LDSSQLKNSLQTWLETALLLNFGGSRYLNQLKLRFNVLVKSDSAAEIQCCKVFTVFSYRGWLEKEVFHELALHCCSRYSCKCMRDTDMEYRVYFALTSKMLSTFGMIRKSAFHLFFVACVMCIYIYVSMYERV